MEIFLLRHFESLKNTQVTFSSIDDTEELTEQGMLDGKRVANGLKTALDLLGVTSNNIYCANSVRAKHSSQIIADILSNDSQVIAFQELLSTKSKDIMGKTKEQVRLKNPLFMKELSLYDAGIFSSYDFHRDVNRELKIKYEQMVCDCVKKIINFDDNETAKIICLHNSSITAVAINIARELYNYPKDFYGKVIADNGKIFWMHCEKDKNELKAANCDIEIIVDSIKRGII